MTTQEHAEAGGRSLWPTRLLWAALGAGVTAVLMSEGREVEGRAEPAAVGSAAVAEAVQVEGSAVERSADDPEPRDAESRVVVSSADVEPASETGGTGSTGDTGAPSDATAPDLITPDHTDHGSTTSSPSEPPPTDEQPPEQLEIPLPHMPGARVMSRGVRKDDEHGGWVLTLALSIPAPGTQVEAFYRSALADAGLSVSGSSDDPGSLGTGHRASLRGRGRAATVQLNVQQREGTLRSVVRIFWRVRP